MQMKTTMRYYYAPLEQLKNPDHTKNTGENPKQLDVSYGADGNEKWYNHIEKQLKVHLTYDPAMTPEYVAQKNENLRPHKNLYINAHCGFVIAKNCKQHKMPFNR